MIAVDTNVLVRYIVLDDEQQSHAASLLLDGVLLREEAVFVSTPVVCELIWVLEQGYGFSVRRIGEVIAALLEEPGFNIEHPAELANALKRYGRGKVGLTDLLIGEIARSVGCQKVYTFDRALAKLPEFEAPAMISK